jgi:hypothetical protein
MKLAVCGLAFSGCAQSQQLQGFKACKYGGHMYDHLASCYNAVDAFTVTNSRLHVTHYTLAAPFGMTGNWSAFVWYYSRCSFI